MISPPPRPERWITSVPSATITWDVAARWSRWLDTLAAETRGADPRADEQLAALRQLGAAYRAQHRDTSAIGRRARPTPDVASSSAPVTEITTAEAADVLHVSARQVTRLALDGRLTGRQRAGRWWFDLASVHAHQSRRSA